MNEECEAVAFCARLTGVNGSGVRKSVVGRFRQSAEERRLQAILLRG